MNSISDSKKFWQIVKLLFSKKVKAKATIKLAENNKMIDDEIETAKLFNECFANIVKKLGLLTKEQSAVSTGNNLSEVEIAIAKYRNHSSITGITEKMATLRNTSFGLDFTFYKETVKEVNNLKVKKVSQKTDIPTKIIMENIHIICYFLCHDFNNSLSCSIFPTGMKYAVVTPTHKKDDKTDKENYRPVSILPNLSEVYEKLKMNRCFFIC